MGLFGIAIALWLLALRPRAEPIVASSALSDHARVEPPAMHSQSASERAPTAHERATEPPHSAEPHPITSEHQRLYREVDLLEGAAAALRAHAPAEARALLASYRDEYAPAPGSDYEALTLLADCVESQSEQAVARVQAFYDTHTGSLVRRQLRTQCLQAQR